MLQAFRAKASDGKSENSKGSAQSAPQVQWPGTRPSEIQTKIGKEKEGKAKEYTYAPGGEPVGENNDKYFFRGITISVLEYGSKMSARRKEIISSEFKRFGGKFIELEDVPKSKLPTGFLEIILICPENMTSELFNAKFRPKIDPKLNIRVVSAEWLTRCFVERRNVPFAPYEIKVGDKEGHSFVSASKLLAQSQDDPFEEEKASGYDDNCNSMGNRKRVQRQLASFLQSDKGSAQSQSLLIKPEPSRSSIQPENNDSGTEELSYSQGSHEKDFDLESFASPEQSLPLSNEPANTKPKFGLERFFGKKESKDENSRKTIQSNPSPRLNIASLPAPPKSNPENSNPASASGSKSLSNNVIIIKEMEKLLKVYINQKDIGRTHAYRRAIATLKTFPKNIESEADVENLPGIGDKLKQKIKEILETGKLLKAEVMEGTEENRALDLLSRVWGIGPKTAKKLYERGIKTIEDLRQNQGSLTKNQKIGLKYFEELQQRIPREEATVIVDMVKAQLEDISESPDLYEAIACGSFRRGRPSCGDIDILISRKDGKSFGNILTRLVERLTRTGLLTDHLTQPSRSPHGSESFMGVCRLEGGLHRRIDLKVYPRDEYGYAVLYFTGSDEFNRGMRFQAMKLGFTLSDHGLFETVGRKGDRPQTGKIIPCATEEEVFAALGMSYKAPSEREV